MITRRIWTGQNIPAIGLGCWAIGGPFFSGTDPLGWGKVDDGESLRAIARAIDLGIRFFDTAQAYGTGHSEELLGQALAGHGDVLVATKIGYAIDPATRQFVGEQTEEAALVRSIEDSLKRLRRERLDLVLLHLNECPVAQAEAIFDLLARLRAAGKIGAHGWSTDFPDRAQAFAKADGFVAIEHAMNVFFRAEKLMPVIEDNGLISINRSPLAMGLLTGKYDRSSRIASDDVRSHSTGWMRYFKDGRVVEDYERRLNLVRGLLQSDGRSLVQGALGWLLARSNTTLPIPGFRNVQQVEDIAGALKFGPLPIDVMAEIERVIEREEEGEPRAL